jgi:hypothetical protein
MTRNRTLGASRLGVRSLATGALVGTYCLATTATAGLILIAANGAVQAKAGSGGGHGTSGHSTGGSSHGANAHNGGPGSAGVHSTVGGNGSISTGVSHPTTTPAEASGHGGHTPCSSPECP